MNIMVTMRDPPAPWTLLVVQGPIYFVSVECTAPGRPQTYDSFGGVPQVLVMKARHSMYGIVTLMITDISCTNTCIYMPYLDPFSTTLLDSWRSCSIFRYKPEREGTPAVAHGPPGRRFLEELTTNELQLPGDLPGPTEVASVRTRVGDVEPGRADGCAMVLHSCLRHSCKPHGICKTITL